MSDWDILVRLASAPGWCEPSYGGGGGPIVGNPVGNFKPPSSDKWNCSTANAKLVLWGAYLLGKSGFRFELGDWQEWMIQTLGSGGGVDVCVRLGLAERTQPTGLPMVLQDGDWYVAQSWNAARTKGHAFLLRVMTTQSGDIGLAYLEANNVGMNGLGSRSCDVPISRWGGDFPANSLELESPEDIEDRYDLLYTARLL